MSAPWCPPVLVSDDYLVIGNVGRMPAGPAVPLTHWRSVDWRFLIPWDEMRCVTYVPAPPPQESQVLESCGVRVLAAGPGQPGADVVVMVLPPGRRCGRSPCSGCRTLRLLRAVAVGRPASQRLGQTHSCITEDLAIAPCLTGLRGPGRVLACSQRGAMLLPGGPRRPGRSRCDAQALPRRSLRRAKSVVARLVNRFRLSAQLARDVTLVVQGRKDDPTGPSRLERHPDFSTR